MEKYVFFYLSNGQVVKVPVSEKYSFAEEENSREARQ